ncbi:MAG TPA: hypothetical protein PKN87_10840 [Syntrophomonadaceae bacterium]|nr:hypothetical protein [Syntrophomonadaceae bacterium]HNX29884.1 hypothetical protein [Syntrophomonadaceae bacterium]HPR93937.1 hypothetical protein [Syntrophomonadaceae bacterium]
MTKQIITRFVEAYVGEYASGKSEMAINRALELTRQGRQVTLVDLDTVEPFYTLRSLQEKLENLGVNLICQSAKDAFGLGETGAMLNPKARWALRHDGDIILDIGYGVNGARTLNLVEGANESTELKVMLVINYTRPMTNSRERIKEYIKSFDRVDFIVANTHLGEQTTIEVIIEGNEEIIAVADELSLPVAYMAADISLVAELQKHKFAVPVKLIKRYMPEAIWS